MTHRYENLLLGLISEDRQHEHQAMYYGSERVYAAEYGSLNCIPENFARAAELNDVLMQIFEREPS